MVLIANVCHWKVHCIWHAFTYYPTCHKIVIVFAVCQKQTCYSVYAVLRLEFHLINLTIMNVVYIFMRSFKLLYTVKHVPVLGVKLNKSYFFFQKYVVNSTTFNLNSNRIVFNWPHEFQPTIDSPITFCKKNSKCDFHSSSIDKIFIPFFSTQKFDGSQIPLIFLSSSLIYF